MSKSNARKGGGATPLELRRRWQQEREAGIGVLDERYQYLTALTMAIPTDETDSSLWALWESLTKEVYDLLDGFPIEEIEFWGPLWESPGIPNYPGVYIMYDDDCLFRWVYVGQAEDIKRRVCTPDHKGAGYPFMTIRFSDPQDRFEAERRLIKSLKPLRNGRWQPPMSIERAFEIGRYAGERMMELPY